MLIAYMFLNFIIDIHFNHNFLWWPQKNLFFFLNTIARIIATRILFSKMLIQVRLPKKENDCKDVDRQRCRQKNSLFFIQEP